jgi:serine/threonine protein kinase
MAPAADCNLATFYTLASAENIRILRTFFGCMASTLRFLHDAKIRHRDIKPENILVKSPNVFFADFGVSLDWENLTRSTTTEDPAKSLVYCAPEVARGEKRNGSADIWSLGCVFLEMFTVIKGRTIGDMRRFFRERNESHRYYENISATEQWLAGLQPLDSGLQSDTVVSGWIAGMLRVKPEARINAERLSSAITTHHNRGSTLENPYCGQCCIADTTSLSESGSDRDPLADTTQWGQ